ncbi:MAG: RDD family protein [Halofilum sp. (in: g-proteobacteria)]|nr:RDD family protein [Halofilum sp. (in: g-proteobacteria)]
MTAACRPEKDRTRCPKSPAASLPRRLVIIVYDGTVAIAILLFAALPVVMIHGGAIEQSPLFGLYLLLVVFAFFGGFWTHGGQTLGMRAWGVRAVRRDGGVLRWRDAATRYIGALVSWLPAGLGFLWCLVDREGLAWHDRLSGTELRRVRCSARALRWHAAAGRARLPRAVDRAARVRLRRERACVHRGMSARPARRMRYTARRSAATPTTVNSAAGASAATGAASP